MDTLVGQGDALRPLFVAQGQGAGQGVDAAEAALAAVAGAVGVEVDPQRALPAQRLAMAGAEIGLLPDVVEARGVERQLQPLRGLPLTAEEADRVEAHRIGAEASVDGADVAADLGFAGAGGGGEAPTLEQQPVERAVLQQQAVGHAGQRAVAAGGEHRRAGGGLAVLQAGFAVA